jgi:predicted transcriptional regulator
MDELFDLETRRRIFGVIEQHPGVNLSSIAQLLGMNVPLVDYHTRYFEKQGLVSVVKEGGFKRFFVAGVVGVVHQRWFGVLRQEMPLRIVLFLLKNPRSRYLDLCGVLSVSKSTVSYHMKKLVRWGVVVVSVEGEGWVYSVFDEKLVVGFLVRYKPSRVLRQFAETWEEFGLP